MASIICNSLLFDYDTKTNVVKSTNMLDTTIEDYEEITDDSFFNHYEDDTYDGLYLC